MEEEGRQPEGRSWAETSGQVMARGRKASDQGSSWGRARVKKVEGEILKKMAARCHSAKGVRLKAAVFWAWKRLSLFLFKRGQ